MGQLLPTTVLNSRWPGWALDGFDDKSARLQFALHLFSSTADERAAVFAQIHTQMLCPADFGQPSKTSAKKADGKDEAKGKSKEGEEKKASSPPHPTQQPPFTLRLLELSFAYLFLPLPLTQNNLPNG